MAERLKITDCPLVEVSGIPQGMEARVAYDEIIIWDGNMQYHTAAPVEDCDQFRKALKHHWATVWSGLKAQ